MLNKNTLFVVGAGASEEFGLPLGGVLSKNISASLKHMPQHFSNGRLSDIDIFEGIQVHAGTDRIRLQTLTMACSEISEGLLFAKSIDNFVNSHRDNQDIAFASKIAIASLISRAESKSRLAQVTKADTKAEAQVALSGLRNTWLGELCTHLFANVSRSEVETVFYNCAFLCFNYDRVIQEFLCHAVSNYYRMTIDEARLLVSKITIIHPYGNLGDVSVNNEKHNPFGNTLQHNNLLRVSEFIRTFSEGACDEQTMIKIDQAICQSEQIVFLGFGYIGQNIQLLSPKRTLPIGKLLLGTAFGMSESNRDSIKTQVAHQFDKKCGVNFLTARSDLKCTQFLSEYERLIFN